MRSTVIRIITSSLFVMLVSQGLWALFRIMGITLFSDARYWCTWGPIAQGLTTGVPSAEFLYWSLAINLVTALIFVLLYRFMKKSFTGGIFKKGLKFSGLVFLAGSLPVLMMGGVMVYLSPVLIVLSIFAYLVVSFINGVIVASINRN